MVAQSEKTFELKKLIKRREELRFKLKDHFCLPVIQRDYKEFEAVVDEMDGLRKKIMILREG